MDLNPAQYDAVHTLSGPLLVLAGAGTGKTRVVTYRIAELIRNRIRPERILAVTFTNKAADEMQQRAAALLGKRLKQRPEISTFHSLCVRILRRHIRQLGYPANFAIYDRGDQEGVARTALARDQGGRRAAAARRLALLHRPLEDGLGPAGTGGRAGPDRQGTSGRRRLSPLPERPEGRRRGGFRRPAACAPRSCSRKFPKARQAEAGRFDHLLVDEYQDTNASQYRIVKALAAGHRNLCVVGDDDQSIYGWRGAEVAHILRFKNDWPEAKVVRLEVNYRSTREILAWANRLIAFNKLRHAKVLRATCSGEPPRILQLEDEVKEAKTVVGEIAARIAEKKRRPKDFAILCRTNEQPRAFEMELRQAKIPYVLMGGMSFYDRKEVRDMLAYLKLLANPADEVSLLRIINVPARGIGQTTVKRLMEEAVRRGKPLWEVLPHAGELAGLPAAAVAGGRAVSRDDRAVPPADRRSNRRVEVGQDADPRDRLQGRIDAAVSRRRRAGGALGVGRGGGQRRGRLLRSGRRNPRIAGFLQEVALTGNEADQDKESKLERNAVALMTLHAAKGLEFPEVYMVGMEEGTLPHHRSIADAGRGGGRRAAACATWASPGRSAG